MTARRCHCDVMMMSLRCRHAVSRPALTRPPAPPGSRPEAAARRRPGLADRRLAARRSGLAYSVYALTGSTLASAAALLAAFVPQVLVGSIAGVFVDRWDRKRTMVVTNLLLAVGLLAPPGRPRRPTGSGWSTSSWPSSPCVEVFFAPAEQAFLPRVVDDADLVAANGLNGQIRNLARLVGSGIGGVVAATGGIRAVAVADAITFLVAALLVARIRTAGRAVAEAAGRGGGRGRARPRRRTGRGVAGRPPDRHLEPRAPHPDDRHC